MTQRDLAAALKMSRSFVAKVELGERRIDLIELLAILRATGSDERVVIDALLKALPAKLDV